MVNLERPTVTGLIDMLPGAEPKDGSVKACTHNIVDGSIYFGTECDHELRRQFRPLEDI